MGSDEQHLTGPCECGAAWSVTQAKGCGCAGAVYLIDFFISFLIGFTVEHNLKRRVIMRPDLIMRCVLAQSW